MCVSSVKLADAVRLDEDNLCHKERLQYFDILAALAAANGGELRVYDQDRAAVRPGTAWLSVGRDEFHHCLVIRLPSYLPPNPPTKQRNDALPDWML